MDGIWNGGRFVVDINFCKLGKSFKLFGNIEIGLEVKFFVLLLLLEK